MLNLLWRNIVEFCEQESERDTISISPSLRKPFLHDIRHLKYGKWLRLENNRRLISGPDSLGRSPLHVAIAITHWEHSLWDMLRSPNVDLNARDLFGRTALHVACDSREAQIPSVQNRAVRQLLDFDLVDIFAEDLDGFLPIDYAIQDRRLDILETFQDSLRVKQDSPMADLIVAAIFNLEACDLSMKSHRIIYEERRRAFGVREPSVSSESAISSSD
ncbi:Uu.00g078650.m01.CDS01 [Anthostomella pinea]|uniref:Uu.00g078650.m01.CDS01 n=1 Tax=Anthostomella pinea TaxID=933095 RepID=A0AAI8VKN2_9PEZI|nr:Uu.00g078650.m01.CDS01 [Anthostomella pinea]